MEADGTLRPTPTRVVRQSSSMPSIPARGIRGKTITDYEDDEESDDDDYEGTTGSSYEGSGADDDVADEDVIPVATLTVSSTAKKRSLVIPTPVPRESGSPFEASSSRRPKPTPVIGRASSSTMSGRGSLRRQVVASSESGGEADAEIVPETVEVEMVNVAVDEVGGHPEDAENLDAAVILEDPIVPQDPVVEPIEPPEVANGAEDPQRARLQVEDQPRSLLQGKTYQCFFESLEPYEQAMEDPNISSIQLRRLVMELSALPMREDGETLFLATLADNRKRLMRMMTDRMIERVREMENLGAEVEEALPPYRAREEPAGGV